MPQGKMSPKAKWD